VQALMLMLLNETMVVLMPLHLASSHTTVNSQHRSRSSHQMQQEQR
jgi:hypothetical protein